MPLYLGSASTFTLGQASAGMRGGNYAPAMSCIWDRHRAVPHWRVQPPQPTKRLDRSACSTGRTRSPDFFTTPGHRDVLRDRLEGALQLEPDRGSTGWAEADWARKDGGEAGLHPSNLHDNAYAIGAVDFTGDMPVILGPDGPSAGRLCLPGGDRRMPSSGRSGNCGPGIRFASSLPLTELKPARTVTRSVPMPQRSCRAAILHGIVFRCGGPLSADRIWRGDSRPESAVPCAGAAAVVRAASARGYHRSHAGHPAACRSTTIPACSRGAAADYAGAGGGSRCRRWSDLTIPSRIVHLPLVLGRPGHPLAIEKYMRVGAARCALVPEQHRVHPPNQRALIPSTT